MSKRELKALQDSLIQDPNPFSRITRNLRRALLAADMVIHSPMNKLNPDNQNIDNPITMSSEDGHTQSPPTDTRAGAPPHTAGSSTGTIPKQPNS